MIQGFSGGLLNRELIYNLDLPSFQRDFASLKTLDHGTGPAITFARASDATFFDANGDLQTAANDVARFDHDPVNGNSRGLLIEEARTNSLRNSQGGGAVVGAPGTLPTNWTSGDTPASGITREIVATGTVNGMSYVDIRFSGTATVAAAFGTRPEGNTQVVASDGQTWTASAYVSLAGGSTAGLSSVTVSSEERQTNGTAIASTVVTITSGLSSTLARYSATRTLGASAGRVSQAIVANIPSGATIDITLRIAAPQLELGAFPTSYIPTTSAAATRSADSAVVTPIASFYNQAEGTIFAEASSDRSTAASFPIVTQLATDDSNRIALSRSTSTSAGRLSVVDNSVTQAGTDIGSWPISSVAKVIAAYRQNDFAATANGASVTTDTLGTVPPASSLLIGSNAAATIQLGGHIRKIAYYPKRLTNTLLEQLTT